MKQESEDERMIWVCKACLRASCWHGEFYCEEYRVADVIQKSIKELKSLDLEHPSYWELERQYE